MKLGDIYTNRQFPDLKVKIIDIGKYENPNTPDQIVFQHFPKCTEKEPTATLSEPNFHRFYKI